jgi:hypothetical protein
VALREDPSEVASKHVYDQLIPHHIQYANLYKSSDGKLSQAHPIQTGGAAPSSEYEYEAPRLYEEPVVQAVASSIQEDDVPSRLSAIQEDDVPSRLSGSLMAHI